MMKSKKTLLLMMCLIALGWASQAQIKVKINPSNRYTELEGWGVSLCWWAHMVGQWQNEQKMDEIVDLLVNPDKLNMNIFRYNIGGGDDPEHYSIYNRETKTMVKKGHMSKGIRTEMEGFKAGVDEPYNWNADAGQRKIMLKIKEKRPDAIFEAFSNSPPYWMTFSGCSAGNVKPDTDNLKPEYYGAFCDYLIEVCKHYKEVYGIEFATLEPFNESLSNYWPANGSQEGCHFDINSQMELIRVLYPKLQASRLNTVISASDETSLAFFLKELKAYIDAGDILDKIGQLNVHTYQGNDEERVEVRNLVAGTGKKLWQSETGKGGSGLASDIQLLERLFSDMNKMRPAAWLDWQFLDLGKSTWGQVEADFLDETYPVTPYKNYYVRMQATRFIKLGYTIIESGCTENEVLTAISPKQDELVISLINNSEEAKSYQFDLSNFKVANAPVKVFRTSASEDCAALADLNVSGSVLNYEAQNHTVTTFVIKII